MEKDATLPNDAPSGWGGTPMLPGGELTTLARLSFYCDVLGARVLRELPGTLSCLRFAESQILKSAPFGARSDQPAVINSPLHNHKCVISERRRDWGYRLPSRLSCRYATGKDRSRQ